MKVINFKLLFKVLLTISVFSFLITSCSKDALNEVKKEYTELDNLFSEYSVVKIDQDRILEYSKEKHNEEFTLDLQIKEKPNWVFNVNFYDFFKEDYKAFETDAAGNWVEVIRTDRSDSYHGQSVDLENKAMFIMEDHIFLGNIYEGDIEYFIEPLKRFVKDADPELYVYYPVSADIAGRNISCGNTDDEETLHFNESTDYNRADCREMSIMYTADFEYREKFNGSTIDTRNDIEHKLRFASYRYWGYNNYPLYFWCYRSYIRTTTSNPPATHSKSFPFLGEWRDWGRTNVTNGDSNLLFTGKSFGSLFGKAYIGKVCKYNSSGQRKAYAIVTKNNGVSIPVYSKVTAHEIGHNLGCHHTNSGFMQQGTHSNTAMPSNTRSQLNSYILNNNSCIPWKECVNYR